MWECLVKAVEKIPVMVRVVMKDEIKTVWSNWLTFPAEGYGEVKGYGPFLLKDVVYIEIDSTELRNIGRLLPAKEIDHSKELVAALVSSGINFERNLNIFRIYQKN
jgi:hypothetical protein